MLRYVSRIISAFLSREGTLATATVGVALRCGQIEKNRIRLFAGCGIVAGSNPQRELAESQAKFAPMLNALGSSS